MDSTLPSFVDHTIINAGSYSEAPCIRLDPRSQVPWNENAWSVPAFLHDMTEHVGTESPAIALESSAERNELLSKPKANSSVDTEKQSDVITSGQPEDLTSDDIEVHFIDGLPLILLVSGLVLAVFVVSIAPR